MNVTDTLANPAAPDQLPVPAAEPSSHSADSLGLFWIMIGLGGIALAGLVNLLTGFLSH